MATINRVRCNLTGTVVGGGIATFYTDGADTDISAIRAFWVAVAPSLPAGMTITVPNVADQLRDTDGQLLGSVPLTGSGTVVGSGNSAYSAGIGAFVSWVTADVVGRKLVKGRTFLAPLGQGFASVDGTLNDSTRAALDTAALALVAAGLIMVWHRPTPALPTGGSAHLVVASQVIDRVTALKSRRY